MPDIIRFALIALYFTGFCVWVRWTASAVHRLFFASAVAFRSNVSLRTLKIHGIPAPVLVAVDFALAAICAYFAFSSASLMWGVFLS